MSMVGRVVSRIVRHTLLRRILGSARRGALRGWHSLLLILPLRGLPTDRDRDSQLTQIRSALRAGRVASAHRRASALVRQHDNAELHDVLAATSDFLCRVRNALDHCVEAATQRVAKPPVMSAARRRLEREHRIFLSGYFYSGSGAVLDWLRDFEGTVKWAPGGEMRLIKFPGGMADLVGRCDKHGRLRPQDVVDLYLHLVGNKITLSPPGTYNRWEAVNRDSSKILRSPYADSYLRACLTTFLDLAPAAADGRRFPSADLEKRFRACLEQALDGIATDANADLVLVDQAINAWRLPFARLVPPSTFIVVHRDPRDQFAEAKAVWSQPGRGRTSVRSFARTYREQRSLVERAAAILERDFHHRIIMVGFEDFVLEHSREASRLVSLLGLESRRRTGNRFQAERSRRNIGKYVKALTTGEIAALVDALPEYLDPRLESLGPSDR